MESEFVDVRIVDLDTRRTTWSRVHDTMRVVFLRLNKAPPDLDWTRLFNEERESRINLRRCGLWIEDDSIGFDCLLHEVEAHHLPDIQRSIDYANKRYREVLTQRDRAKREWSDDSQAESSVLKSLRDRVRAAAEVATPAAPTPKPAAMPARDPAPVIEAIAPTLDPRTERAVGSVHTAPIAVDMSALAAAPVPLLETPPPVAPTPPFKAAPPATPAPLTQAPLDATVPPVSTAEAPSFDDELEQRRQLLRERYRAALTAKIKETSRGDE